MPTPEPRRADRSSRRPVRGERATVHDVEARPSHRTRAKRTEGGVVIDTPWPTTAGYFDGDGDLCGCTTVERVMVP